MSSLHYRNYKKNFFCIFIILSAFLCKLTAQGILEHPRKVYKIKTQYFDILFSEENLETANLLAQKADDIFEQVKETNILDYDFRMPVIISPDSEVFSVQFTTSPYNRIIIFDSPSLFQNENNTLLECFKREVAIAQLKAIRSDGSMFVAKFFNNFRPVELTHLPENFIKTAGRVIVSSERNSFNSGFQSLLENNCTYFSDLECMEFLVQSKIDGSFPSWMQTFCIRDIYPGQELFLSINAAFNAFLIQNYGFEKYDHLWELSSQVNFHFIDSIFYSTYGLSLSKLWAQFEASISYPKNLEQINFYENASESFFENDKEASYDFMINSDFGLIWYDKTRNEVDIYDPNSDFKIRELLFLASDIKSLSLSEDSRYIAVSYEQTGHRSNFIKYKTEIFDLLERKFLKESYDFAEAFVAGISGRFFFDYDGLYESFENLQDLENPQDLEDFENLENFQNFEGEEKSFNLPFVGGIALENGTYVLKIESLASSQKEHSLLFKQTFQKNLMPSNVGLLNLTSSKYIYYLLEDLDSKEKNQCLCLLNLQTGETQTVQIFKGKQEGEAEKLLKIRNLKKEKISVYEDFLLVFEYFDFQESNFSRFGYIDFSGPEPKVQLQNFDLFGGVHSPTIKDNQLFYSAHKFSHSELKVINMNILPFEEGKLVFVESTKSDMAAELSQMELKIYKDENGKKYLNGIPLSLYLPFPYFFPPSVIPLVSIKEVSLDSGVSLSPALGFTLKTGSDPLDNTKVTFSANAGFAKLSFEKFFTTGFQELKENPNDTFSDIFTINTNERKNFGLAAYIENFSTPIDLKLGSTFNFNTNGEYDFTALIGTSWTVPFRMNFRNLTLSINGFYSASTDYHDSNLLEQRKSMSNWPELNQSYDFLIAWAGVEYSNVHQYGISKYEERGLSIGGRVYSMLDLYEKRLLDKKKTQLENSLNDDSSNALTKEEIDKEYDDELLTISQINSSIYADVFIPRLTPLQMNNGWVLSVPTSLHVEFLKENGNAMNLSTQFLIIGREIQNGIPFLQLFFLRSGLMFGYDFNLNYDTALVRLPDLRRKGFIGEVFSKTYVSDSLYLLYDMDFTSPLGYFSNLLLNASFKVEYYPRNSAIILGFEFTAKF